MLLTDGLTAEETSVIKDILPSLVTALYTVDTSIVNSVLIELEPRAGLTTFPSIIFGTLQELPSGCVDAYKADYALYVAIRSINLSENKHELDSKVLEMLEAYLFSRVVHWGFIAKDEFTINASDEA